MRLAVSVGLVVVCFVAYLLSPALRQSPSLLAVFELALFGSVIGVYLVLRRLKTEKQERTAPESGTLRRVHHNSAV